MPKSDLAAVRSAVIAWFADHRRDLPWRSPDCTPWGVLVSEIMLQQTPVARVLPQWLAWMHRWPTPADLATAPTADVLRAWDRLGYPRRALRLQECAAVIVAEHGGQVPATEAELRALPGVGEYTAAAVIAFAYAGRSVVLDTNVRRVIARAVSGEALPPPYLNSTERRRAGELVPQDPAEAALWAAASMELGALVCTAKNPLCDACPIASRCEWLVAGRPADDHAHRRRTQAWHGTDRQVRGRIMAELRQTAVVNRTELLSTIGGGTAQVDRCLTSLARDGLIVEIQASGSAAGAPRGPGSRTDRADSEPAYRLPS